MVNPPTFPRKPAPGAGRTWPVMVPLIVFGVILSIILLVTCSGGFMLVSGAQFHPQGFQIRRFTAYRVPLFNIQAGRTSYTDETPKLSKYLVNQGWISKAPLQAPEDQWELIELNSDWTGMPVNLTDYLREENSRVNLQVWSQQNPLLAAMLWSEIEQVAKLKLYWMAPEMIDSMVDFSRNSPIDQSFSENDRALLAQLNLTAYLLSSYQKTADGAEAAGETQLAAACRQQIERLSSVGIVAPAKGKNSEKSDDPQSETSKSMDAATTTESKAEESSN